MTVAASTQPRIVLRWTAPWKWSVDVRHRIVLRFTIAVTILVLTGMLIYGLPYYRLDLPHRPQSPLDTSLRPGGHIGIRLGLLGLGMFFLLFLYPIRKRWSWIGRIGKTRHWLDFHVLLGVAAPIVITLHSSFKLGGLAGAAYWIMMAVAISGFVGRYLYAQLPRTVAAELTLAEMEAECARLADQLRQQSLLTEEDLTPLMRLPSRETIAKMSLVSALARSIYFDCARPFQVSRLRRKFLTSGHSALTLWGLLTSGNEQLESIIRVIRAHSWMSTKLLFWARIRSLFHLWHVVHRPFSYGFVVLVIVHVSIALLFGYF